METDEQSIKNAEIKNQFLFDILLTLLSATEIPIVFFLFSEQKKIEINFSFNLAKVNSTDLCTLYTLLFVIHIH